MNNTIQIDKLLCKLEPVWGKRKVEAIKLSYQIGNEDKRARLEKIINLSASKLLNDSLLNNQILLPPATKEECLGKEEVFLADICYGTHPDNNPRTVYPLYLDYTDVKNHMILTGLSGMGKTTLAYNLLKELAGKGINCLVFDWDRTWRNFLSLPEAEYPFIKDIRVYTIGRNDLAPFSWNMFFSPPPGIDFSSWLGIVSSKPLQKSLLAGQGVEDFIENEAEKLMQDFKSGVLRFLPNAEDMKRRISNKFAKARELLWKQSAERVLKDITRESIKELFGSREPMNISEEIINRKGITILEMDIATPEHLRVLFQELFLTYFMLCMLDKGEAGREEIRCAVFLEEFPNMLPKSSIEKEVNSDVIRTIFREGRKFGVGLIAIAQETSELPNYVLANAKVQVHFACQTKKDIDATASSMFLERDQIGFIDLLKRGEAIAKVKGRVRNCLIKIRPPFIHSRINDDEIKERLRDWRSQN
jgi:shikimate kinase